MDDFQPVEIHQPPLPRWRLLDVILITAGAILIFVAGILLLRVIPGPGQTLEPTVALSAGLSALEGIALIGSAGLLGLARRRWPPATMGFTGTSMLWWGTAVGLGLLAIPLTGVIALLVQMALGLPIQNPQLEFLAPEGFTWTGAISMFLMGGILAPIGEEVYFRGVLYPWMRTRWGIWPSILASSLIFGVIHGDIAVGSAAFVLGIFMAWIYERSGSLWTAILIHIINNAAKIALLYALLAMGGLSDLLP